MRQRGEVTQVLEQVAAGDRAAVDKLMTLVYGDLRSLAGRYLQREDEGHTLQPTALVNEVFLKLVDQKRATWENRSHFFAICATMMRRILVDHARGRSRARRGGGWQRVPLSDDVKLSSSNEEDVLVLEDALTKLEHEYPKRAKIVELRFFGGLTIDEAAEALSVSRRTAVNHWRFCKAWLRRELDGGVA